MNLQAVSALYRLPAETTLGQLTTEQILTLGDWALALDKQCGTTGAHQPTNPDMLLSEWMDREVEAASKGSLNPQN
jgi:hypothetical protein